MTVLETTAVVRNHRVRIDLEVPESVAEGTPLRVTVTPAQGAANGNAEATSTPPNPYPVGSAAGILFALDHIHPEWKGSSPEEVEAELAELAEGRGFEDPA